MLKFTWTELLFIEGNWLIVLLDHNIPRRAIATIGNTYIVKRFRDGIFPLLGVPVGEPASSSHAAGYLSRWGTQGAQP